MTPQEAIERVKIVLKNCEFTRADKKSLKIAISALEKQIPKKPIPFKRTAHDFQSDVCKHSGYYCEHIKPFNHEYQYIDYKCPACGHLTNDGVANYCGDCGQALDWSELK